MEHVLDDKANHNVEGGAGAIWNNSSGVKYALKDPSANVVYIEYDYAGQRHYAGLPWDVALKLADDIHRLHIELEGARSDGA